MHIDKTRAMAGVALLSALSLIFLLLGTFTFMSLNTIFFTALAAYFIGYTINKYALFYGGMQLVVCTFLDLFLNPDKFHWVLYVCLGGYIFFSEMIFQKMNRVEDFKKKMRRQLLFNWVLFNIIYIPLIVFFRTLLFADSFPGGIGRDSTGGILLILAAGQIGWIMYDKAYRVFFRLIRERKL